MKCFRTCRGSALGLLLAAALLPALAASGQAQTPQSGTAPVLGLNSGFQAGPNDQTLAAVRRLDLRSLRDGVVWERVERQRGRYDFDSPPLAGLRAIIGEDRVGSLTVYPTGSLYENGDTVTGEAGIEAFAEFVGALARRFPGVESFQINNEFNSRSFVRGPAKEMTPAERARLHARYLAAVDAQPALKDRRIIGGSAHSIAGGYIWEVLDAGGAAHMDAVAVHPYTSRAEQIPAELGVLRRHPDMAGLDIEVTEFGTTDVAGAPDYFWKSYCMMAAGGVSRAVWYSLEDRGEDSATMLDRQQNLTPVGRAIELARERASGRKVEVIRPDPFTYGCLFDGSLAVLWGAERSVELRRDDLLVSGADPASPGQDDAPQEGGEAPEQGGSALHLSRDKVLLLRSDGAPIRPYEDIVLGQSTLLADSFDQFRFPPEGEDAADRETYGFARVLRRDGQELALVTCPGQQRPRTSWKPFLCSPEMPEVVVNADEFVLSKGAELVHRYMPQAASRVVLELSVDLHELNDDGIGVTVQNGGQAPQRKVMEGQATWKVGPLDLKRGEPLEIVFDHNTSPVADAGTYHIAIREAGPALRPGSE